VTGRSNAIAWEGSGDDPFELEPQDNEVLLTVIHRRLPDRANLLGVGAGWHMRLEVLVACGRNMSGKLRPD
jgi:hypothetical protein